MDLTDNLIAWYRAFDNTDSTGSYDLILQNNASTSSVGDNKCGSYFTFPQEGPGPVSYLEISTAGIIPFNSDDGFTLSLWAYNITTTADQVWLFRMNSHHDPFFILNTGNIAFRQDCFGATITDSGYDLRSNISADTWHHLAMVISGSSGGGVTPNAKYYLDGSLVTTITLNAGCNPFNGVAQGMGYINNEPTMGGYKKAFERLTDIAYWDRALSGGEVEEISTACLNDVLNPPPPGDCIQPETGNSQSYFGSGFVINNYKNLSGGRDRRTDQVPFSLGTKDRLGLRLDNTIFTPSGSVATYCTGS
jgi:hypothetical protein